MPEGTEPKKKVQAPTRFGVYQKKKGSYTLRDVRFEPLTAVPVTSEIADLACEDSSPVTFFDAKKDADDAIARLKAKFDAEAKNPQ